LLSISKWNVYDMDSVKLISLNHIPKGGWFVKSLLEVPFRFDMANYKNSKTIHTTKEIGATPFLCWKLVSLGQNRREQRSSF
jgi:hypothetical protein